MSETQEETQERRYTICVDCDGVLHSYVSGWQGADVLPDPPVPGAIEWLNEVAKEYDVVVLTTRASDPLGAVAVDEYLYAHGFEGECVVTAEKVPALMYVDDRGWRFTGRFPTLRQLRHMKPWRTGDPPRTTAGDVLRQRGAEMQKLQDKHSRVKWELRRERERTAEIHAALHDALDIADGETCDYCPKATAAA